MAALLATDPATGMFNRANVALCLSHLFLFLGSLWKFSYETDLRDRMNKEPPFEQLTPTPPPSVTPDESKKCSQIAQVKFGPYRTYKS